MTNSPHSPDPNLLHLQAAREGDEAIARALALVRFLRERCPWDAKQTPTSLRPYLLEEAHEVADAVAAEDDEALPGELGDLLLNVAFQIVLAEERGAFDAEGVTHALETKMEHRHPHVYGDAESPPDWETMKVAERTAQMAERAVKAAERARASGDAAETADAMPETPHDPFEGLPTGLDPLSRAARVQERMAAFGFDWPDLFGPLAKVREETEELAEVAGEVAPSRRIGDAGARVEEEVGDLFFAVVNASRVAGAHPANALLAAIAKFEHRCRRMIELAEARGVAWQTAGLETLDQLWNEVKRER